MAKNKQQPGRVKSALLNWLGVPISLTTGEFWREWYGTSSSGKVVTADKVIRLSAVWACVRLFIKASANGWYIGGNIVFGGLIGWLAVDPFNGGMYTLKPKETNAILAPQAK